jgi:glucuronokinase
VPARAGLVGHPSDGYGGATLAVTLSNFAARVEVRQAGALSIEAVVPGDRPEGGDRLVRTTVTRFRDHCAELGDPYDGQVAIRYRSTIPREVGLAGSSAIVIAVLTALARVSGRPIEPERMPDLALSVETRLGIVAGLQDRVVQAIGGLVFMDFEAARFEPLDAALLPDLFVAWNPSAAGASGAAHASVRLRHERGERAVVAAMRTLGRLARDARMALVSGDRDGFLAALDAGYDLRAAIFDLDRRHTAMIEAARRLGLPATYTGSGGAIVGIAADPAAVAELADRLQALGARLVAAHP